MRRRSNLATALRTEVRRLAGDPWRATQRPLARLHRQVLALRMEARAQRLVLARLERRLAGLGGRLSAAPAPGRRGRPLSGNSIRRFRDRLRMTREQFARALGVSPGSIFGWESGRTAPRRGNLSRFDELRKMGVRQARARFTAARPARQARGKTARARRARRRRKRS